MSCRGRLALRPFVSLCCHCTERVPVVAAKGSSNMSKQEGTKRRWREGQLQHEQTGGHQEKVEGGRDRCFAAPYLAGVVADVGQVPDGHSIALEVHDVHLIEPNQRHEQPAQATHSAWKEALGVKRPTSGDRWLAGAGCAMHNNPVGTEHLNLACRQVSMHYHHPSCSNMTLPYPTTRRVRSKHTYTTHCVPPRPPDVGLSEGGSHQVPLLAQEVFQAMQGSSQGVDGLIVGSLLGKLTHTIHTTHTKPGVRGRRQLGGGEGMCLSANSARIVAWQSGSLLPVLTRTDLANPQRYTPATSGVSTRGGGPMQDMQGTATLQLPFQKRASPPHLSKSPPHAPPLRTHSFPPFHVRPCTPHKDRSTS